jgi:hypothetical protein
MDRSPNLDLPYILPAQAQKHVTHNEAIRALDAIVQLAVLDRDRPLPPDAPEDGDRHIVAAGAAGEFAGRDSSIAAWQDGAWMFHAPQPGWRVWVEAERLLLAWDGSQWIFAGGPAATAEQVAIGGATADDHTRLAVNAPASLFYHAGSSHRLAISRDQSGDTASILFQTGFSGRAEFGLAGDDAWRVKLSADGEEWIDAIAAHADGRVELGGPLRLALCGVEELPDPGQAGSGAMICVSDAEGEVQPAWCDGAVWRRLPDGSPISPGGG